MEKDKLFGVYSEVKGTQVFHQVGLRSEEEVSAAIAQLDAQTYIIREGKPVPVFQSRQLKENERLLGRDGRSRVVTPGGKIALASGSPRE
jgi:hypothetical protein